MGGETCSAPHVRVRHHGNQDVEEHNIDEKHVHHEQEYRTVGGKRAPVELPHHHIERREHRLPEIIEAAVLVVRLSVCELGEGWVRGDLPVSRLPNSRRMRKN